MSESGTLYDQNLTQWLQLAGEYIGHVRPENERVGWVMFLFEQIKPFMGEKEFRDFVGEAEKAMGDLHAKL